MNDVSPDFYHFRLSGLSMLVESYGQQSAKVATAVKLLEKFLAKVDVKRYFQCNFIQFCCRCSKLYSSIKSYDNYIVQLPKISVRLHLEILRSPKQVQ